MTTSKNTHGYESDICSMEVFVQLPGGNIKVKTLIEFKDVNRQLVSVAASKQALFQAVNIPANPDEYQAVISLKDGREIPMDESQNTALYKDDITECNMILFRLKS